MPVIRRAQSVRWSSAVFVLVLHLVALAALTSWRAPAERERDVDGRNAEVVMTGFVVEEWATQDRFPVPKIEVPIVKADSTAITAIQFESSDWGDISGVVASASAPQLSRFQPVSASNFARRAGLAKGEARTAVVNVEVRADGTVGYIELSRSSGRQPIDEAAIAYARRLRWIPGTSNHHAQAVRVSLPITLVWT